MSYLVRILDKGLHSQLIEDSMFSSLEHVMKNNNLVRNRENYLHIFFLFII